MGDLSFHASGDTIATENEHFITDTHEVEAQGNTCVTLFPVFFVQELRVKVVALINPKSAWKGMAEVIDSGS